MPRERGERLPRFCLMGGPLAGLYALKACGLSPMVTCFGPYGLCATCALLFDVCLAFDVFMDHIFYVPMPCHVIVSIHAP